MFKIQPENRSFYKKIVLIAVPVIFQNLISIGLNLIDSVMIGKVGVNELAGVGAANQIYFIFTMVCFGLYSGAAIYSAQFYGAGDIKSIRKVAGIDFVVGTSIAFFVTLAVIFFAPNLIWLFSREKEVIEYGTQYIHLVCFSYVITSWSYAISYNSRAIQKLMVPTVVNGIALLVNTVLNYGLIYGKLGMPQLGVRGAAVATLIARVFEVIVLFAYVYRDRNHPLAVTRAELFHIDKDLLKKVMKKATPVMLSEGSWSTATAIIFMAYGFLGGAALAIVQVANVISEFFQSFYFGVGNAAAVIIGEELGKKNRDKAEQKSWTFLKIVLVLNLFMTIFLISIRGVIAAIYDFDPDTTVMLKETLLVWSLFLTPKMLVYIFICGILRSGGDTHYCMVMDLVSNWLYGIPAAFFGVLVLKLPIHYAVGLVSAVEIYKAFLLFRRFKSKKWIQVLVD